MVTHPSTNWGRCCLTQVYQAVDHSSMPITTDTLCKGHKTNFFYLEWSFLINCQNMMHFRDVKEPFSSPFHFLFFYFWLIGFFHLETPEYFLKKRRKKKDDSITGATKENGYSVSGAVSQGVVSWTCDPVLALGQRFYSHSQRLFCCNPLE